MVLPLTKSTSSGTPYARPAAVEAQIQEVIQLELPLLRQRLLITQTQEMCYLRHECLVHLVRHGRRTGNQTLIGAVLPVLLSRCEANLLVKVQDGRMPDAATLREEILGVFSELFGVDGSGDHPDELDIYECRFNMAFRALRIDAVRREADHLAHFSDPPTFEASGEPSVDDEAFERVSDAFKLFPTHEWDTVRDSLVDAIAALPPDEHDAVILVHVLGYKEESEDPDEETAATRSNCTGRTIRNRLTRAIAKLSRFKENI